jgi:phytoene desaturase
MTAVTLPYTLDPATRRKPHALVIGSGFGGLAAAIRLGARGYRVTVLERLDQPGGRASVFRQDGFTFDAGPTIVTAPFLFEELWALCGRSMAEDVDLRPLDPFYRIRFDDGSTFDCTDDPERMRAEVAKFSPGDVAGYEAFLALSREVYRVGFEELGHVPFDDWTSMLKALPDLVRLGAHRTVYGTAAKYVRDERLRTLLSFHPLFIGGNPFSVTALYVLISYLERQHGVHFAMGGTGSLVRGLVRLIERQGNRVLYGREVAEILVEGRKATGVRLSTGETVGADIVVSNADSAWTLRKMLPETVRGRWTDRKLDRSRYSMGLFVWYFGTNRTYPDVPHHTILMGPRYRDLLTDIFSRKVLAEDFSLYLHRPTATDPSLAPPGHDAFYVLSPVPNLEGTVDWTRMAETYRQRIAAHLSATILPGLDDAVVTSRMMTPLDFQDRYLAYRGAAFGLEPILTQSAWFRPHNRFAEVDGLYLVGAGTHPGAGLPGVLTSAKLLDQVVPDASVVRA